MRQCVLERVRSVVKNGVERKQKERAGMRAIVPRANGVRDGTIAHEDRMHRRAEESLDEQRRRLIRAEEVGQWSEDRAVAELVLLAQESSGGGRKPDAFALERVEGVDLALKRRVGLVGAEELRARDAFLFSRLPIGRTHLLQLRGELLDALFRVL